MILCRETNKIKLDYIIVKIQNKLRGAYIHKENDDDFSSVLFRYHKALGITQNLI